MPRITRRRRDEDEPATVQDAEQAPAWSRRPDEDWGVAAGPPRGGSATHYQAARLPELGDVVVAVTRLLDPISIAPERHQLRAISASAPDRARLLTLEGDELLDADGALAWADVDLRGELLQEPWPRPEQRIARIVALRMSGATPATRAAHATNGLADWLLTIIETELAFATWLGLEGSAAALDAPRDDTTSPERALRTGDFGTWGADWLERRGYAVDRSAPGSYRRALNAPLLSRLHAELRA